MVSSGSPRPHDLHTSLPAGGRSESQPPACTGSWTHPAATAQSHVHGNDFLLIMDDGPAYTSQPTTAWLAGHPDIELLFTPEDAAWVDPDRLGVRDRDPPGARTQLVPHRR